MRTPLSGRRLLLGATALAGAAGVGRVLSWLADRTPDAPQPWPAQPSTVFVSVPSGGLYGAETAIARDAVTGALPAVNAAAGGRITVETVEVAVPRGERSQLGALAPLLASGAPPELITTAGYPEPGGPLPEFAQYASSGLFAPLDPYTKGSAWSAVPLPSFYPAALASCRHRGALLGLPLLAAPVQFWYDAELFDAGGVAPPTSGWDWQRMAAAARQLTDASAAAPADRQFGLSPGFGAATLLSLIWQNGGDAMSADQKHVRLGEAAAREAATFFAGFYQGAPPMSTAMAQLGYWPDGIRMNSGGARLAMAYESFAWAYCRPWPIAERIRVEQVPRQRERATALGVPVALSVSRRARDPDASATALALLADGASTSVVASPRRLPAAALHATNPQVPLATVEALVAGLGYARMALLDDLSRTLTLHITLGDLANALRSGRTSPAVDVAAPRIQSLLNLRP